MREEFKKKKVLIIGGTGTIGKALVKNLLDCDVEVIRIYSRDEYKQFILSHELSEVSNVRYLIGDVRDKDRLMRAMAGIDIVFNLAAMKHVPACEYNPFEAVKTNIMGVQNVIDCAMECKVKKVIYTSSDKAISPTNTMGATKLLAERLMTSANYSKGANGPVFSSVRFGNVMGSRGSVIPLFKKQIIENSCITITEPQMTRFMMSVSQAVDLTIKACTLARGGEVFVLKMPVVTLKELGEVVIQEVCRKHGLDTDTIKIKQIGLRPGEKMYEELMSLDEADKAVELEDMFMIQSPYNEYIKVEAHITNNYSSEKQQSINKKEITELLLKENLI